MNHKVLLFEHYQLQPIIAHIVHYILIALLILLPVVLVYFFNYHWFTAIYILLLLLLLGSYVIIKKSYFSYHFNELGISFHFRVLNKNNFFIPWNQIQSLDIQTKKKKLSFWQPSIFDKKEACKTSTHLVITTENQDCIQLKTLYPYHAAEMVYHLLYLDSIKPQSPLPLFNLELNLK